jgi:hypothetical protein
MAYFTYKKLNVVSVTLLTVTFGLLIAAAAVDWYRYEVVYSYSSSGTEVQVGSQTLNYTKFFFDFEGQTMQVRSENKRIVNTFTSYDDLGISAVEGVFRLSQAFTLLALLLAGILALLHILYFFDAVRNKILFWVGLTTLRVILIVLIILVVVCEAIAFLGFLGIQEAFESDNADCTIGPCKKFSDSVSTEIGTRTINSASSLVTQTSSWGPDAGWFVVLASIPITLLVLIVVVLNKFPIPVDSMATGEAL